MRKYFILPAILAVLLFTGQSCLPDAQIRSDDLKDMDDQAPATTRPLRLRTEDGKDVAGNTIRKTHVVGRSACPDGIGSFIVDLGQGITGSYRLVPRDLPKWLNVRQRDDRKPLGGQGVVMGLEFNCNVSDRSTHLERVTAGFTLDCEGCLIEAGTGWRHGDPVELPLELDLLTREDAAKRGE